jgi:hypothetical protein
MVWLEPEMTHAPPGPHLVPKGYYFKRFGGKRKQKRAEDKVTKTVDTGAPVI